MSSKVIYAKKINSFPTVVRKYPDGHCELFLVADGGDAEFHTQSFPNMVEAIRIVKALASATFGTSAK